MLQFGEEKDILLMALHFFPSHFLFFFFEEKGSIKAVYAVYQDYFCKCNPELCEMCNGESGLCFITT